MCFRTPSLAMAKNLTKIVLEFGVGGGIRTLDSRSHSPEFYH